MVRSAGSLLLARLKRLDGTPLRMSGINLDISELKQAEQALQQSQELFEGLANTLPGVVFVTNPEGGNVYTNAFYQALTGLSAEELLGDGWLTTLHPEDRERAAAAWKHACQTGSLYELNTGSGVMMGPIDGSLARALPQRESNADQTTRWVGVSLDIHDRKEAEEQAPRKPGTASLCAEGCVRRNLALGHPVREGRMVTGRLYPLRPRPL